MKELTPQDVADLHDHMAATFGATLVNQSARDLVAKVEAWLVRQGIADVQTYMNNYSTTVGSLIYTPYAPGVVLGDWSLAWQCSTIAHECHHVWQFKANALGFPYDYLTNTESRAFYESEAYRATNEVEFFLSGTVEPPDFADCLYAYYCSDADVAAARQFFADVEPTIRQGGVATETAKEAISFLKGRGYGV